MWIKQFAGETPLPERARKAWQTLMERWSADLPPLDEVAASFDLQQPALAHLLAVSPVAAEKLAVDPAALVWLANPSVRLEERSLRRMEQAYQANRSSSFDSKFRELRRQKSREMLRLALRDLGGTATIEQTTSELSNLADLCLQTVCNDWLRELTKSMGAPRSSFAVLGMGKLGGMELNYSSDVDVMFVTGSDDDHSARFFTRLAEKIIGAFAAADPAGALFRIDLRLRPEGSSGPLIRSVDSMEAYYSGFGETWERMALIKARVTAGSDDAEELGYELSHRLQPFVFPRSMSLEIVDEIRAIKKRIEREIVGEGKLHRNVKLGYGGIREIEFIAQTLQLLHGAKHAFLQERNTLKTLAALRQLGIIPHEEMQDLIDTYRFLRTVEHRLQIEREAQTHVIPEKEDSVRILADSLALSKAIASESSPPIDRFRSEYQAKTGRVREIFDRVLASREAAEKPPADLSFFRDARQASSTIHALASGNSNGSAASLRTRRSYARLEPLLLDHLRTVADPDLALTRFVRFVEKYGMRALLYETLIRSPRVLEMLVRLFDASEFFTEIVLRQPQLIEEVTRGTDLGRLYDRAAYLEALRQNEEGRTWQEWERTFKRAQFLRIGLRDLLGFSTLEQLHAEITSLAEACIAFTAEKLGFHDELTIVAMGKFGGRELGYGADLDIILIGEQAAPASELIRALSIKSAEGAVFEVDLRLRPEGEAGPLAIDVHGYQSYFEKRAQLWEAQALTKARPIHGGDLSGTEAMLRSVWERFCGRTDLATEIASMHRRIVQQRAGSNEALDFKTGAGGLMQVEFFTQCHQMRSRVWEQNTLLALQKLASLGEISLERSEILQVSYRTLRKVESVLRRMRDESVSMLPQDRVQQEQLANRCGYSNREQLLRTVDSARKSIADAARIE